MRIDLHSHSTRSDGKESPTEVFEHAAAAGVNVLALTDHDTTSGWAEAALAASRVGLGFVPGIEVTTRAKVTRNQRSHFISVHMLAYLPDSNHEALAQILGELISRCALITLMYQSSNAAEHSAEEHSEILKAIAAKDAQAILPYSYAGTMGLVQRDGIQRLRHAMRYSRWHATICVELSDSGWIAGVGSKRGVDLREAAEHADLIIIWGGNPVNTQINVMQHAIIH